LDGRFRVKLAITHISEYVLTRHHDSSIRFATG
jgi:hypothetical protein